MHLVMELIPCLFINITTERPTKNDLSSLLFITDILSYIYYLLLISYYIFIFIYILSLPIYI